MRRLKVQVRNSGGPGLLGVAVAIYLLLGLIGAPAGADGSVAVEKIVVTMDAAIAAGPEVRARIAGLHAESSDVLAELGPGVPYFSWQREGIGGGFESMPNALESFRLSTPFNVPWRVSRNRDVRDNTDRVVALGARVAILEVAGLTGRSWIDLAAETEKAGVFQTRLARLQKAMEIQRRKFELGEISGSEKTQLELQLAREAALLGRTLAGRRALEERVLAWTAGSYPPPEVGDLASLVAGTGYPERPSVSSAPLLAENLWLLEADSRAELAQAESKLTRSIAWGRPEADVVWQRVPELDGLEAYDAFGFRIGVPIHLGKAGKKKVAASEFRAEAALAGRERLRLILESRLAAAQAAMAANELILSSLEPTLEDMPRTEFSLSEQFRLGAISYLVYLDGLARLDDVRLQLIESRRALLWSRLELAELTGDRSRFPSPGIPQEPPVEPATSPSEVKP